MFMVRKKEKTSHKIVIGDSRNMNEVKDGSVHLVITSPPYWQLKDYGSKDQIGFNDSYQDYIDNLNKVWKECYRVLQPGCRLCVNIGDQFARAVIYGRYKVIPIRTEITKFCESIGFDYMGGIIWQKVTTCKTTGGATIMGSYPYPRGGIIKIDYEFILIFKKLGKDQKPSKGIKEKSKLTHEEWNEYFNGHWNFPGEKQNGGHIAMFPLELPKRLIKMFSFYGDTVLDPFLGSGTTSKAALGLGRNSIGYEINKEFLETVKTKIGIQKGLSLYKEEFDYEIVFQEKNKNNQNSESPAINNNHIERLVDPKKFKFGTVIDTNGRQEREDTHRVTDIPKPDEMMLDSGLKIKLLGVAPIKDEKYKDEAISYLKNLVSGNRIFLKYDDLKFDSAKNLLAYAYLVNKTFLNAKLIRNGLAKCDTEVDFQYRDKFTRYEKEAKEEKRGIWDRKG